MARRISNCSHLSDLQAVAGGLGIAFALFIGQSLNRSYWEDDEWFGGLNEFGAGH
jgi:hypothetical protein